jgi:hypothetical protein
MQSAGILQHGFVKNPARRFPDPATVYRGVNKKGPGQRLGDGALCRRFLIGGISVRVGPLPEAAQ